MSETRRAFLLSAMAAGTALAYPAFGQPSIPHEPNDPMLRGVDGWLLCSLGGQIFLDARDSSGMIKPNYGLYFCHPNLDELKFVEVPVEQLRNAGIRDLLKNRKILELWE